MRSRFFNTKILPAIFILPIIFSISGCVYMAVGGLGVLGGYVVSPDTVEGVTEHDAIEVWDAAVEVISIMGTIQESHEDSGFIIAKVSGATVNVSITALSQTNVKLSVKARKAFFPKISVSQDIFVKIISHLDLESG